ncbi:uncharacterized protein LOC110732603 [Chenopodium quinoa]|uniref:uncharacterized protein LOC110732603 n=1 Tax=Chenopodium quinoa TaxID=63459 RepID=UPI000B78BDE1|nr:uncharacterized protein LOC110732603 [Chenopodium quinoa]
MCLSKFGIKKIGSTKQFTLFFFETSIFFFSSKNHENLNYLFTFSLSLTPPSFPLHLFLSQIRIIWGLLNCESNILLEIGMATMKRRYNPDVPIDITSDEVNGEVSAEAKDENKNVKVKVVKWSYSESEREEGVFFKIEIGIPFRWLMIEYCQKLGLDYQTTRFELNGAKLRETDTPHQLRMLHDDVIFALPNRGSSGFEAVPYVTLIILMHKEKDTILRLKRSTAILPQLMQCFPNSGSQEQGSLCFVYRELKLTPNHTANELKMEDGDIIDCFNFKTMSKFNSGLTQSSSKLLFSFDGRSLSPTKTVAEEDLVDGGTISSTICFFGCLIFLLGSMILFVNSLLFPSLVRFVAVAV